MANVSASTSRFDTDRTANVPTERPGQQPKRPIYIINAHGNCNPESMFMVPKGLEIQTTCRRNQTRTVEADENSFLWLATSQDRQTHYAQNVKYTVYPEYSLMHDMSIDCMTVFQGGRMKFGGVIPFDAIIEEWRLNSLQGTQYRKEQRERHMQTILTYHDDKLLQRKQCYDKLLLSEIVQRCR